MGDGQRGYLATVKLTRKQALELLAVAVGLGLGIQLVGSYLAARFSAPWELALGGSFILVALIFLFGRALVPAPRERELQGFIVYDRETGHLAEADREYDFGRSIKRFIDSAFAENRALKIAWEKRALHKVEEGEKPTENYELLRQAVEYYVLAKLSTHLIDYFSAAEVGERDLYTVSRADLPDVLLENRFMKLFTEPIAERPAWIEEEKAGDSPGTGYRIMRVNEEGESTMVSGYHPSGAYFDLFELVLPKGSKVKRVSVDTVEIDTPKFSLQFATAFRGVATNLPFFYDSVLLGFEKEWERASFFGVDIWVRVAPKRFGLLSGRGWSYYRWIDEWLQSLEDRVSRTAYLDRVGWDTAEMTYRLVSGHGERQHRRDEGLESGHDEERNGELDRDAAEGAN